MWTFHLDPNLMWSDDTPVTADDYVATFRLWRRSKARLGLHVVLWRRTQELGQKRSAGTVPVDQLGVKAVDANTLQFTTVSPAPYLPAMMLYSDTMQKKALDAHGGLYNSDPATSVSSGPFVLKEWSKGERLVYEANPKYKGTNKPFIQKLIVVGAAPSTDFASYQAGEIDYVVGSNLSPADNEIIESDATLKREVTPSPTISAPTTSSLTPRNRRSTTSRCARPLAT